MRFRIDRDALAEAVAWTARTLPARPPVPVLAGMRLEATEESLTLSAFDYETSAEVSVSIGGQEPGTALVSGKLLADICRALPPHPVDVTTDGAKVMLHCGSAKFTLQTMPVEDYPSLPQLPPVAGVVGSDEFAAAVAQVAVAAGRDDTIPMLTGVRVEIDGDTVTLASTDRYRLAVREFKWTPDTPDRTGLALIPAKTLADTAKSLTSGAEVKISLGTGADGQGEGMIGFEGGGRKTTSRLLDGDFVKYRSLFPAEYAGYAEVQTSQFVDALKRVSLVAERNTPVRLQFSQGEVVLEAGTGDEAQAVEALEAVLEGEDINIAFNHQYVLDGLSHIGSDTARLSFTTPTKPAVLTGKPTGDEIPTYRYLIMPVRLSG
ncbi:DNA polymerase III subunit beta [Actinocorallia sp. API 0066]|uniref:DNA polymerase III subunit beta n=1 Tax=Actinocorallia sp. API 0066 TaxID=2896846 RepID=UPI001E350B95|nr:DNA polymerase III subunit beta [Actinocorallia sp. API 0066]MCD0452445.1 DNA polymerase III subunit beta [Actinocorallia sp. API 0066]